MTSTLLRPHTPRLPTEVCERIINFVVRKTSLHSCALVCRSWLPRSRTQLYQHVDVRNEQLLEFVDAIASYPHLGIYVKQLYLLVFPATVCIYRFFSNVVPFLPKLTSLTYISLSIPYHHLSLFPSGFRSLTSLRLLSIRADSFGEFIRFVSFHKRLIDLEINGCSWKRSSDHHYSFAPCWGGELRKLSFSGCEYNQVIDLFRWLARRHSACAVRCLEIEDLKFSEQSEVPFVVDHIGIEWVSTLKVVSLGLASGSEDVDGVTKPLVSGLVAFIGLCSNLHTVKFRIRFNYLWVLRQLPDVLSGLVSLRRLAFGFHANADIVLLRDNEETWKFVDRDLADPAKFTKLEYVEVKCRLSRDEEVSDWWEEITRGGAEYGGRDGTESREEYDREAGERDDGWKKNQQQQWVRSEAHPKTDGPADVKFPSGLHDVTKGVAEFHSCKSSLTDVFPHLSARGILWCGICPCVENSCMLSSYVLHITPLNLKDMESRNWRPRYCQTLFDKDVDYN